jgi:hypothetical protein
VASQLGHLLAQGLDQQVEDLLQERAVWLLTKHVLEAGHVPLLGYPLLRLDANDPAQPFVAAQLGEHGFGGDVPQGDAQYDHSPEHVYREVVAALAAGRAQRLEQLAIWQSS